MRQAYRSTITLKYSKIISKGRKMFSIPLSSPAQNWNLPVKGSSACVLQIPAKQRNLLISGRTGSLIKLSHEGNDCCLQVLNGLRHHPYKIQQWKCDKNYLQMFCAHQSCKQLWVAAANALFSGVERCALSQHQSSQCIAQNTSILKFR